jgi:hypothetical protein
LRAVFLYTTGDNQMQKVARIGGDKNATEKKQRVNVCATCEHWDGEVNIPIAPGAARMGLCRARPPRVHFIPVLRGGIQTANQEHAIQMQPYSPATEENNWCGEHTATQLAKRREMLAETITSHDDLMKQYDPGRYDGGFQNAPSIADVIQQFAQPEAIAALEEKIKLISASDNPVLQAEARALRELLDKAKTINN